MVIQLLKLNKEKIRIQALEHYKEITKDKNYNKQRYLKYKKQFHHLLWNIREPKIRKRYHPSNLITLLEGTEEDKMSLDELDELLEKW